MLAVAAIIGIPTVAWYALRPSDPMHKGRPISDWIDAIGQGKIISIETRKEFREMGSVAVPYLIKGLKRQNSALFTVQSKLYNKLPK
jgi:hypothetical protein